MKPKLQNRIILTMLSCVILFAFMIFGCAGKNEHHVSSDYDISHAFMFEQIDDEDGLLESLPVVDIELTRRLAEGGDAVAQNSLGLAYVHGRGVEKDYTLAVEWFRKAAEQGYAPAQSNLGTSYSRGNGVDQDYTEAVKWYRKAEEQFDDGGQYHLGRMYLEGRGLSQDYSQALSLFRKAAEQGYAEAQNSLGYMYRKGFGVSQDNSQALFWFRKSAEQNCASAQFNLGYMYQEGLGVKRDYSKALAWYYKAAKQEDSGAQYNLGYMFHKGLGVKQDYSQALFWFRKAAEQGDINGHHGLGISYEHGYGVNQDYAQAIKWYLKAAEQGHSGAQFRLGVMYKQGHGVIADEVEAYAWFLIASKHGSEPATEIRNLLEKDLSRTDLREAQRRARIIDARIASGEKGGMAQPPSPQEIKSSGTGFFICPSGYLVTAQHVVEGADKIEVVTSGGRWDAQIVFSDRANDTAILRVQGSDFVSLQVASSQEVKVGNDVFTVGFPLIELQGSEPKYTNGVISSLTGAGNDFRKFQIAVPVQPGNSGGPLLNSAGKVIGLVTARLDDEMVFGISGSLPQNVNYAIKSDYVIPLLRGLSEKECSDTYETTGLTPIERARSAVGLVLVQ